MFNGDQKEFTFDEVIALLKERGQMGFQGYQTRSEYENFNRDWGLSKSTCFHFGMPSWIVVPTLDADLFSDWYALVRNNETGKYTYFEEVEPSIAASTIMKDIQDDHAEYGAAIAWITMN